MGGGEQRSREGLATHARTGRYKREVKHRFVRVRTSLQVGEIVAAKFRARDYDLTALCKCAYTRVRAQRVWSEFVQRGHACISCALVRRGVMGVWARWTVSDRCCGNAARKEKG